MRLTYGGPNPALSGTENYVDQLELGAIGRHSHALSDVAVGAGAYAAHNWSQRQKQAEYAALDHGDVATAEAIERQRRSRTGYGKIGLAFFVGLRTWWIWPVLYVVLAVFVFQPLHLSQVNQTSWPAAIITLLLFLFAPRWIIKRHQARAARRDQTAWNEHYISGQRLAQREVMTPERAASDPYAPPPLSPLDDEAGTTKPVPARQHPAAPGSSDDWLAGSLSRMRRNLGLGDGTTGETS